jgi:phosphoribosylglycinamide formyltransferase 1
VPKSLIVMASGKGSLFRSLIRAIDSGELDARIDLLIVDRDCPALESADLSGIDAMICDPKDYASREDWDNHLWHIFNSHDPDLVICAGFMRVLGPGALGAARCIINTHPSLLPKYPGMHAVRQALEAGESETGATVHYVDAGLDTGEIISQISVPILETDTEESLHETIKTLEKDQLLDCVKKLLTQDS